MKRAPLALATGRPTLLVDVPGAIAARVADAFAARRLPPPLPGTGADLTLLDEAAVIGAWMAPTPAAAAALAPLARAAAADARPLVVWARPSARVEEIAAVSYLRAAGAAVVADPDAWIEALCLLAAHGTPAGARVAVVAAPDSYLAASAVDDGRRPSWAPEADAVGATDVVLLGRDAWTAGGEVAALRVPLCERGESLADAPVGALCGLRPALAAVAAVGRAVERARGGLGPAPRAGRGDLEIDEDRLSRQLGKIAAGDRRLGDHEAKVLLSSYGVAITRQAVATSPSMAQRLAAKAGFPVDVKAWGPDVPSERDGAPIERGLASAADVRRAFAAVLAQAGQPLDTGAVIVRASPPAGRPVRARVVELPALGPTVIVEVAGQPPEAAPAPLRVVDATALAQTMVATRAGDDEPDRVGLANLLRRASHLAVDCADRLAEIVLAEIVVGGRGDGALVVDAEIRLRASGR